MLLTSLFLLSVLSTILTGYPERQPSHETQERQTGRDLDEEPSVLVFKVSPPTPQLYWRIWSADYYTGLNWLKTTDEKVLDEFPEFRDTNATEVFTVEINSSEREIFLPLASSSSTFANISSTSVESLEFYSDTVGNVYRVIRHGQALEEPLIYQVSWSETEIDDRLISLNGIPEEILSRYLQLPNLPIEVRQLAMDLKDSSYSILDQILADVQFLRTNFVYETERTKYLYDRVTQGSRVSSYIERRKGICIDAATALAIILRVQQIPARISIGYNPGRVEGGKLLYYTTEAHSLTEVYLPPYGWIQFDATPPLEESPMVEVSPFKKEASPGSTLFYQLSITNRRNLTDNFNLLVGSKRKWNIQEAPEMLRIEALQTAHALLEVTIPDDANLDEKDVATLTVASMSQREIAYSIWFITQVKDTHHISTTTTLGNVDEAVIRGDTLWVNGEVLAPSDEQVNNMAIFVFMTKSGISEGTIVGRGYSDQGNFQIESTVPPFMEIGDYKVVAVSLGTALYSPSRNDSITRVRATTRMKLGSEEEFLLGYGAIHGYLSWDNGTGLAQASISLKITSLTATPSVWEMQNLTYEDGSFRIETQFENSGVYEIEAAFAGDEYVSGSNASRVVELKRGLPEIQIESDNSAVRGEVFNISGTIRFRDTGIWGEPLTVAFDNQLRTTVETQENGSYTWSFFIDPEEKLGPHYFEVKLEKSNVSAIHMVTVKSKTTLITKVSNVAGGLFHLFSAYLSDDHGRPIQGEEIAVDNYHLSWKTDSNGNLTFLLDTIRLWPENLVLRAEFEGSESYLPVTAEREIFHEAIISLPFLIPLVSPPIVAMSFVYAKYRAERRQVSQQTLDLDVARESAIIGEKALYRPQKMQPFRIVLPDIEAQFPDVWGINDKLRIQLILDEKSLEETQKRVVEVLIDKERVVNVMLSMHGRAELSRVFNKKGEHMIEALQPRTEDQPLKAEVKLRIVEYGEEIIRLYNEFVRTLTRYGVQARDEMTAREIESLILKLGDFAPEALREVTICFEKAKYGNRLETRKDYETMYRSLRELDVDVQ